MNNNSEIKIDWTEVQGLLHSGYSSFPYSRYIFVNFKPNQSHIKTWLATLRSSITYASAPQDHQGSQKPVNQLKTNHEKSSKENAKAHVCIINLAFTATGFEKAGLTVDDMQTFPDEFRYGMHDERASIVLGDTGQNCPNQWGWGNAEEPVDAVIIAFYKDRKAMNSHTIKFDRTLIEHKHRVVRVVEGEIEKKNDKFCKKGVFGFIDGLSNPVIRGGIKPFRQRDVDPGGPINPGEFLCGHFNERNQTSASPSVGPTLAARKNLMPSAGKSMYLGHLNEDRFSFGLNGSYMVIRQLKQNKEAFDACVNRIYDGDKELKEKVANRVCNPCDAKNFIKAKFLGRWPDGTAMVDAPTIELKQSLSENGVQADTRNDFGFRDTDSDGYKCPFGSHIRRAFPRDSLADTAETSLKLVNRRRLLRRGRNYYAGTKAARQKQGIMFICFNADIGKQFEFVQGSWLNGEKFVGPDREVDPLIGIRGTSPTSFSVQRKPVRKIYKGLTQFVNVLGGSYFFLPSRSTIDYLIEKS